ncbi:major capsid protein [Lysinibacillus sp. SGAir0095]|uniref:major capsid protein n=1 Tax=Lysinibacillus sp. SGAir0095 TaxID=2070463 RepID=UPI0010CD0E4E|nr:major capsid protein [Lysinibacillus sp. SGAir0095]QCR33131.1 phage capsid protein [Lysinibacillus sp. SGAir0095]
MPNIYDLVTAQNISDFVVTSNQNKTPYLGAALFPSDKQLGLNLSYLKGRGGLPVALKPSAFDAQAPVRDRIGVSKVETEMPFFRERMTVKEQERQQINTFLAGGQTQMADQVVKFVFDDVKTLVDGADVTAERMRMQLLSTGKIQIAAEGAQHEYDYQLNDDQFEELTGTDAWTDAASTPVQDILAWKKEVRVRTGVEPTRAILTSATFALIAQNETIRKDLNPLGAQNIILTDEDVANYLSRKTKIQFAIYDDMFIDEAGASKSFFPDGVVTLLPPGTLGKTMYGTTPEESDLMTGAAQADVSIVNRGVAVTTHKIVHPVNVETIVSEIVLPSFEQAGKIFIAKVATI